MAGNVKAIVSKRNLEFTPDSQSDSNDIHINNENEFDVTVVNASDKFASFQIELSTAGVDENSHAKWYRVQPEICAKKPPGSETTFHVEIIKAPIPAYDTTIDLILKVLSVEYENLYTSQKLKLTINKPFRTLRLEVPVKEFKVKPNEPFEIPVLVYNLSSTFSEITLDCLGLNPDWLRVDPNWRNQKTQRIVTVEGGEVQKTRFLCQPPKDTLSQQYKFTIEAKSDISQYCDREQGILEVFPDGVVKFDCSDEEKRIPENRLKREHFATYELVFKNESNLPQQVKISIEKEEKQKLYFETIPPDSVNLGLGETRIMQLVARKRRPLLGRMRRLLFEVSSSLTLPSSGEPSTDIYVEPNSRVLVLKVLPLIPFLLQVLGGSLLLLALLLYWLLQPKAYHEGSVNSVRFFGNGSLVFSGSSDRTIRRWQVNENFLLPNVSWLEHKLPLIAEKEQTEKAIRVIRQSPKDNDRLAVGLENGEVKLWDLATNQEQKSPILNKADRVFDIVFNQNGRLLFSAHASGRVNMWDLEKVQSGANLQLEDYVQLKFTIYALAVNGTDREQPLGFIGGRFNKISVWDWNNRAEYELQYKWLDRENNGQNPVFGQQQYITSLATSNNILVSADLQGYITLWDVNKIRGCLQTQRPIASQKKKQNIRNTKGLISCDNAIIAQKRDGHDRQPVRSVAITQDKRYLVSGGDDGRVVLWSLANDGQSKETLDKRTVVARSNAKINSVDIKALKNYLLIASGDDKYLVRLYRINGIENNENSK